MLRPISRGAFIRGFAISAVLLLLINAAVAYLAVGRLVEGDRWVSHTYEVLGDLDQLMALLREAESNQRTYIITADSGYLERYQATTGEIWRQVDRVRSLTADNPAQQQRLAGLSVAITKRLAHFDTVLQAERDHGFQAARDLMSRNEGARLMDSVAAGIDDMRREELELLQRRGVSARDSARGTYVALGVATGFAFLFLVVMMRLLKQERQARITTERTLQRLTWALQAARGGAWDWDLKSDTAWWSPEMYDLWGLPPGTPRNGASSMAVVDERDRAQLAGSLNSAIKQHLDGRFEFRITHPHSGERWMASFARPFYDEHGNPDRMLGVTIDITEQKAAEEQIRQSAAVLEQFVELAPASLAMFDGEMRYVLASKRWREDCGVGSEELIGRSHYEIFPDLPEHWKEAHRRGLAGESLEGEDEWTPLDGRKHSIRWGIHPWGVPGERTGGIIIFLEDTTERRKIDAALRTSEQQFRTIFKNAGVGVAQVALDGRYLLVNERFCEYLGYAPTELLGNNFREITHANDLAVESELVDSLVLGYTDRYSLEKRYIRKDGRPIWTTVTRSIARDDSGHPLYMVSVIEDISKRKEAEAATSKLMESLARSEQRFRAIYENASIGIEQVGVDGRLLMVNRALCTMLDYSYEELCARTFAEITDAEDLERERKLLAELFRGEREEYGIDKRYIRRNGKPMWVHVHSRLVRDERGQAAYRISAIQDISDRHRAEHAMVMAERISAANKLAGALAHEIVNSVMAIGSVFHLLNLDPSIQSDSKEMLAVAEKELSHVDEITKRALMVSRGGGQVTRVVLPEMIDGMVELYVAHSRRSRVQIETRKRLEHDAMIDTGVVKQVFTNLLTNALDAMPNGGRLRIDLYRSRSGTNGGREGIRLVVADTGAGIARDNMAQIFDPFFTTKGERGTGLGLWVTRGLIVKAGGNIRIRSSQRQGRTGTCVSVFLPCSFAENSVATVQTAANTGD